MSKEPSYYEAVFEVTKQIPYGKVTTYGTIADLLALGSARMVGWALNKCMSELNDIPAHRVVNRKGELSGRVHFSSPSRMQELLEAEGVKISNDKVENFEELWWKPSELL